MIRINVGCGDAPTRGWRNFDNSFSLKLARWPYFIVFFLRKIRLLKNEQYNFVQFIRDNDIEYGDVVKGLPVADEEVDVFYSSHVLEHLDRNDACAFLDEAYRVLCPGGIIRIAVPDLKKAVNNYCNSGDADYFIESMRLCVPRARTMMQKMLFLLIGPRHHQWMYDGDSLKKFLEERGYENVRICSVNETLIRNCQSLNLSERKEESVYVEAERPKERS